MQKDKNEIALKNDVCEDYAKVNFLISGKYRSSLLENKLMALSLAMIPSAEEDTAGALTVSIPAVKIKDYLGLTGNSIYERLDSTAMAMTGRTIGVSSPEKHYFDYVAVITRAKLENGVFSCEFNKHLNKYLKNITGQFTLLNLEVMLSFKSCYSMRLYEILKSRCYPKNGEPETGFYDIDFSVAELKFELGVCNANLDSVKKYLNGSKGPNYDKAMEICPEKIFETWNDFNKRCLVPGVKEINSNPKTNLHVNFEPSVRKGRGGKVCNVVFHVNILNKIKAPEDECKEVAPASKEDILDEIFDMVEEKIKIKDAIAIAEAADYNLATVKEKYAIAKKKKDIDNIVGWLIKAIRDDYEPSQTVKTNKKSKPNKFKNFDERQYDFDELEDFIKNENNKKNKQ